MEKSKKFIEKMIRDQLVGTYMDVTKSKISLYQFILMISGIQIGVGMLSLPRELAEKSGTSSWIALIFGGIISTLLSILIVKAREKAPTQGFLQFFQFYLGKILGTIVTIVLSIYLICAGYLVLVKSILIIQAYLLPQSSAYTILFFLLIPTYQLLTGGINLIAKYVEAIFPIGIFIMIMLFFTLKDPNFDYMLPIIKEGWLPIFRTIPNTTMSLLGIEIIFLIYPYLNEQQKAIKGVIIANLFSTIVYLINTIICFLIFSPYEITSVFDPVIDILSIIEFQYVERLDFVLYAIFLIIISKTWVIYFWGGTIGITEVFKIKRISIFVFSGAVLFLINVIIFIPTFKKTVNHLNILTISGLYLVLGLSVSVWIISIVKKVKR